MTINEIIDRVVAMKSEYRMNSIDPNRVGGLLLDILQYINSSQVRLQSPAIHKEYSSVSEMYADAKPISDLTGLELKIGQLVCIVPSTQYDITAGNVYRYDGPSGNTSTWTYLSKIGGIPADQELNAASSNPIANAPVAAAIEQQNQKVAQLDQEWQEIKDANFQVTIEVLPHIEKVMVEGGAAILQPDKFYMFGEVAQIALDFAPVADAKNAAVYAFQFTSPADAPTTITMPDYVKFPKESDSTLTIKANTTYQINIVEGLAVATSWEV